MDGHKQTLTDETLERDIEAALSVEPSPEFLARVRSRVAAEPVPAGWFGVWRLAGVGVVVAGAVVLFVWNGIDRRETRNDGAGTREAVTESASTLGPSTDVRPPIETQQAATPSLARRPTIERREQPVAIASMPAVVIADDEKRGLALFIEEVREGKDAAAVIEAASRRTTPGPPWLDIDPVVVDPLPSVSISQGEAQ